MELPVGIWIDWKPVYATGPYQGEIAGQEFGQGGSKTLNLRQATKTRLKDNSGTGFVISTAKSTINDDRLKFNSTILFDTSKTQQRLLILPHSNFQIQELVTEQIFSSQVQRHHQCQERQWLQWRSDL